LWSEHVSGAENGAKRAENRVERIGEQALQKNDGAEHSAEREVAERRAGITEIGFPPLTLRSHALLLA